MDAVYGCFKKINRNKRKKWFYNNFRLVYKFRVVFKVKFLITKIKIP